MSRENNKNRVNMPIWVDPAQRKEIDDFNKSCRMKNRSALCRFLLCLALDHVKKMAKSDIVGMLMLEVDPSEQEVKSNGRKSKRK